MHDHGPCLGDLRNTRSHAHAPLCAGSMTAASQGMAEVELRRSVLTSLASAVFAKETFTPSVRDDTFFIRVTGGDVETKGRCASTSEKRRSRGDRAQGQR